MKSELRTGYANLERADFALQFNGEWQQIVQTSDALSLVAQTLGVIVLPPIQPIQSRVNPFHLSTLTPQETVCANPRYQVAESDGDQNLNCCMHLGRWCGI